MDNSQFKAGDFIVGHYNDFGAEIKPGKLHGDTEDVHDLQKMIIEHSARTGGIIHKTEVKIKPTRGRKKSVPQKQSYPTEPIQTIIEPPPVLSIDSSRKRKKSVYLFNALGKIKLNVEEVLESEMAYCLVFANEDDMIFVPKAGETLTFINNNGAEQSVYFANSIFTWVDQTKQLMILFKN
jgi:hypothetical protein